MNVVLFGGHGYLGRHLEAALNAKQIQAISIGPRDDWPKDLQVDRFIHLACPRNKPQTWSFQQAYRALVEGLRLASDLPTPQKLFISSLSVFDTPENPYQQFKAMAELAVDTAGWVRVRLPTLLGTMPDVGFYRADLALHQIAAQQARYQTDRTQFPYVGRGIVRHVSYIGNVVDNLVEWCETPYDFPRLWDCSRGVVAYEDVVDRKVVQVIDLTPREKIFTTTCGGPMSTANLHILQDAYDALVEGIARGKYQPC